MAPDGHAVLDDPFGEAAVWEEQPDDGGIIEQAIRHCPTFPFTPGDVHVRRFPSTCYHPYRLVHITLRERPPEGGHGFYGLYAPFDLRPLDRAGKAFDEVAAFVPSDAEDRRDSWKRGWQAHLERNAGTVLHPKRMAPAIPVTRWRALGQGDASIREGMRAEFQLWKGAGLRLSEDGLRCYPNLRLLEVFRDPGGDDPFERGYALVKLDERGGFVEAYAITGASDVLHDINAKGDLRLSATDPATIEDYVRFFCWAVQSDEGSFHIPHAWGELIWKEPMAPDVVADLFKIDLRIHAVSEEEARSLDYPKYDHAVHACVAYGGAAFEAWFSIMGSGEISMVKDEPRVAPLPFEHPRFNDPSWPVLKEKEANADRHYLLRKHGSKGIEDEDAVLPEASIHHIVDIDTWTGVSFMDEVTIDLSGSQNAHPRPVMAQLVFVDCVFHKAVRVIGWDDRRCCDLLLLGCVLKQGITAAGTTINGSVSIVDCTVRVLNTAGSSLVAADLENTRVKGNLVLWDTGLSGRFYAPGLYVEGSTGFRGVRIANGSLPRRLEFRELGAGTVHVEGGRNNEPPRGFGRHYALCLDGAVLKGDLEITTAAREMERSPEAVTRLWDTSRTATSSTGRQFQNSSRPARKPGVDPCSILWGGFSGRGMLIDGDASFFGTYCHETFSVTNSAFKGSVNFFFGQSGFTTNFKVVEGDVDMTYTHVEGALRIGSSKVERNVDLYGAEVEGWMYLTGLYAKDLSLGFATVKGYAFARRDDEEAADSATFHLSGELDLSGCTLNILEIHGGVIGKKVKMITGSIGRLLFAHGAVPQVDQKDKEGKVLFTIDPCRIGALELSAVEIKENLDLSGARMVPPAEEQESASFRSSVDGISVLVTNSTIGRHLRLFSGDITAVRPEEIRDARFVGTMQKGAPPVSSSNQAWGHVVLRSNRIGGDLDLRNLNAEGDIRLNDTHVGLDLLASGYHLDPSEIGQKDLGGLVTRCRRWNSEKFSCNGDVDISGLNVQQDVEGRGMDVKGVVTFAEHAFTEDEKARLAKLDAKARKFAHIGGKVDLTAIKANHLKLSGNIFFASVPPAGKRPAGSGGVRLERAELSLLEIGDPTPGPLDLANIKVGKWKLGTDDPPTAKKYVEVLRRMDPFDRAVWIDVEKGLRNQNRDADAHRIYRGMLKQGQRERPGGGLLLEDKSLLAVLALVIGCNWKALADFFTRHHGAWVALCVVLSICVLGLLAKRTYVGRMVLYWLGSIPTGSGTQIFRPMIPWSALFILSMVVFSDVRNVDLDAKQGTVVWVDETGCTYRCMEDAKAGDGTTAAARPGPSDRSWEPWDAMFMSLRYHIPIFNVELHDQWRPSQRKPWVLGGHITVEEYALMVSLFSWLAWSLFLIGLSAKALRGKG